jgi:hypothetical protein
MSLKIMDEGLMKTLEDAERRVRRWPLRTCERCHGTGTARYETYEDGWDRTFEDRKCGDCGGRGTYGGGQPGLELWFQSVKERDEFKAKLLRMRGIKWVDEAPAVLESQSTPKWKVEC